MHVNGIKAYLVTVGASLTVALVLQTFCLVYWTARVDTMLSVTVERVDKLDTKLGRVSDDVITLQASCP